MKKTAITLIVLICLMILGGCAGKESSKPMTAKQFKTFMEDKGLVVSDEIDSANGDNSYQEIYVALEENKYSFEYYFMKDIASAKSVYEYASDNLDAKYKEDSSATIVAKKAEKNSKYEVSGSDYYCVVWQNENTVLYLTAYSDYLNDAKQILKELGYK